MRNPIARLLATVVLAIVALGATGAGDPSYRVGRLGYMDGVVGFSPSGGDDWEPASMNRPITTGDRLWTGERSRAELQIGGAAIRMAEGTGVSVLNLNDEITQLRLTQGRLNVRARVLEPGQQIEIDTPNVAFVLRQPGDVRIDVDRDGTATMLMVRDGLGDVYGDGAAYVVDTRSGYRFTGTDLREFRFVDVPPADEFDAWSGARDRRYDESVSARYVSADFLGYQELDAGGTWAADPAYGNVWYPNRVANDWAPYRDGHWAWIDPWGWTWIDEQPWGFAVSHYGRWAHVRNRWGWVPGPVHQRAYYAPALVVFLGGSNFRISISAGNVDGVAWFPLGPREVYRPHYPVSRRYFDRVNRGNTVVNSTVINNYYNNTNITNVTYVNRRVGGAVVAVPATTFVRSEPVSRARVGVSRQNIVAAPLSGRLALAPAREPRSTAERAQRPDRALFERPVVARSRPPATPAALAERRRQRPADADRATTAAPVADRSRQPAATAPVKVIANEAVPAPTQAPPGIERRAPNRNCDRDAAAGAGQADPARRTGERARPASAGAAPPGVTGRERTGIEATPAAAVVKTAPAPAVATEAAPPEQALARERERERKASAPVVDADAKAATGRAADRPGNAARSGAGLPVPASGAAPRPEPVPVVDDAASVPLARPAAEPRTPRRDVRGTPLTATPARAQRDVPAPTTEPAPAPAEQGTRTSTSMPVGTATAPSALRESPRRLADRPVRTPAVEPSPGLEPVESAGTPTATGQPATLPAKSATAPPATLPSTGRQVQPSATTPEANAARAAGVIDALPTATGQVAKPSSAARQHLSAVPAGAAPVATANVAVPTSPPADAMPADTGERSPGSRRDREGELTHVEDGRRQP